MKVCPFCGAELPEEAIYCLNCASVLNERQEFSAVDKKYKKAAILFPRKKLVNAFLVTLSILIVISSCILAINSTKNDISKSTEKETALIPVTNKSGENVTDSSGEQIFEVAEITEVVTEKQGLFVKLFSKNENENKNEDKDESEQSTSEETTAKKPSLFDIIFGNDKDDSSATTSSENAETTTKGQGFLSQIFGKDDDNETTKNNTSVANQETVTTGTTNKAGTTSSTTTTTTTTTTKPTTTRTTTTTTVSTATSTTVSTTKKDSTSSINDFLYTELNGQIKITKYTGSASTVTVPAYINGKHVAYLGENAFANNSSIKKIVFTGTTSGTDRFYLPYDVIVFYNLPNLTSITFPYETYNFMVDSTGTKTNKFSFHKLFTECKKLSNVSFSEQINSDYSKYMDKMTSVDGVVFTNTDSSYYELIYYPIGKMTTNYIMPENVRSINANAFYLNPYIKTIKFTSKLHYINQPQFGGCNNLQAYNVVEDNPYLFSENGVMYSSGVKVNDVQYAGVYYPPGKTDPTFEFTSKVNVAFDQYTFCCNPYIQTAKCPLALWIQSDVSTSEYAPKSLKTIYVKEEYGSKNRLLNKDYTYKYY